jgi:hypothetical protein
MKTLLTIFILAISTNSYAFDWGWLGMSKKPINNAPVDSSPSQTNINQPAKTNLSNNKKEFELDDYNVKIPYLANGKLDKEKAYDECTNIAYGDMNRYEDLLTQCLVKMGVTVEEQEDPIYSQMKHIEISREDLKRAEAERKEQEKIKKELKSQGIDVDATADAPAGPVGTLPVEVPVENPVFDQPIESSDAINADSKIEQNTTKTSPNQADIEKP